MAHAFVGAAASAAGYYMLRRADPDSRKFTDPPISDLNDKEPTGSGPKPPDQPPGAADSKDNSEQWRGPDPQPPEDAQEHFSENYPAPGAEDQRGEGARRRAMEPISEGAQSVSETKAWEESVKASMSEMTTDPERRARADGAHVQENYERRGEAQQADPVL